MQWLVKLQIKKSIWGSLKTSFKWSVHPLQNVIRFLAVNAWRHVFLFSNNLTMSLFTSEASDRTSSTMMTSIGTLESLLLQLEITKMQRMAFFRFKTRRASKTIATCHGYAESTSWTKNLTWLGKSTSIWRHQTRAYPCWIWSQMTVTRWVSSTTQSRLSMFSRDSMPTLSFGKVSEVLQSVCSN